jgi:hypothetical protein
VHARLAVKLLLVPVTAASWPNLVLACCLAFTDRWSQELVRS